MTVTFDAFVVSNELVALMTGLPMDRPPVLIDRGTGASARCSPTRISGIIGMCASFGTTSGREPCRGDNAWCATLPIADDASETQISIVVGDVVQNATVQRRVREPVPEPEPASTPRPVRRRTRKRG